MAMYTKEIGKMEKRIKKEKCTYADGTVYEGDWKDGSKNGKGKNIN